MHVTEKRGRRRPDHDQLIEAIPDRVDPGAHPALLLRDLDLQLAVDLGCAYDMTGLKGTRCPECGSEFTLDELLASQPGKAAVELER